MKFSIKDLVASSEEILIGKFDFLCSVGLHRLLNPLGVITNRLQGRNVDIIEAYDDISSVIKDIKRATKNIDKEFSVILNKLNE